MAKNFANSNTVMERTAGIQCRIINPDNPMAVAEGIGKMYEALIYLKDNWSLLRNGQAYVITKTINLTLQALSAVKEVKEG